MSTNFTKVEVKLRSFILWTTWIVVLIYLFDLIKGMNSI